MTDIKLVLDLGAECYFVSARSGVCVCVRAMNVGRHFGATHQLRSYSAYLQSSLLLVEGVFFLRFIRFL